MGGKTSTAIKNRYNAKAQRPGGFADVTGGAADAALYLQGIGGGALPFHCFPQRGIGNHAASAPFPCCSISIIAYNGSKRREAMRKRRKEYVGKNLLRDGASGYPRG